MRRVLQSGILVTIGFLLSPLSWWNDLLINIPLAYLLGSIFSLISESLFMPMVIIGYWLTNIVGLLLMHYGVQKNIRKGIGRHILISIVYSAIMIVLILSGLLKSPF